MKKFYKLLRRRTYELFGNDQYSRPALNDLDRKLEKYLSYRDGIFIEAGGNDGYTQSNTYYFEKFRGWRGLLVEPVPELYRRCVRERRDAQVYQCALVSRTYEQPTITMTYVDLMSLVDGARGSQEADLEHIQRGIEVQHGIHPYQINVRARTLSSIIDEAGLASIDLLSLDVEGYEIQALEGLEFDRHAPKFILVETNRLDELDNFLDPYYRLVEALSHHDYLYERR